MKNLKIMALERNISEVKNAQLSYLNNPQCLHTDVCQEWSLCAFHKCQHRLQKDEQMTATLEKYIQNLYFLYYIIYIFSSMFVMKTLPLSLENSIQQTFEALLKLC